MGTMETDSSPAATQPAYLPGPAIDSGARRTRKAAGPQGLRSYQQVAKRICELAVAFGIAPGERLPSERELASALAVSRATLRQALTSLDLGGIVEVRSCSGVYLRASLQPGATGAQAGPGPFELLSARRMIEPELAAMAARVATDSSIDAILAAAEEMERSQCEQADQHFHLTLARATGNGALTGMLEHLWSQRGGLWPTLEHLFESDELRKETLADYRRIGRAVAVRDAAGARNAMRTHLERFTRALSRG